MSENIEMGKEYRMGDMTMRVLCVDRPASYPVVAMTETGLLHCFRADGDGGHRSLPDLVEVRPRIKKTLFLNISEDPCVSIFAHVSRAIANSYARTDRIACIEVPIDCEHGHGL